MQVEVGKTVEVSDDAVQYVADKLRKKHRSTLVRSSGDMREPSVDHSEAIAALAIAEYKEWVSNGPGNPYDR